MTTEHVSFDRLNDLVDGALDADDVVEIERHLADCPSCSDALGRLRAILERAASLGSRVDPPSAAWSSIRGRLEAHPVRPTRSSRWWRADSWVTRAAAAILLVVGSSMLTVVALRSRDRAPASSADGSRPAAVATPAAVRAVDDNYARVLEELTTTFREQRGSLTPATIATLERTLRIIDEAIAEARNALAADPGNAALLDVLSANYEQKVQLLRRASELPART